MKEEANVNPAVSGQPPAWRVDLEGVLLGAKSSARRVLNLRTSSPNNGSGRSRRRPLLLLLFFETSTNIVGTGSGVDESKQGHGRN